MGHWVIWFVVGCGLGALASLLMRGDDDKGVFGNVLAGVAGALVGGQFVSRCLGLRIGHPATFNFVALAASLVGAVTLLSVMSFVRARRRA